MPIFRARIFKFKAKSLSRVHSKRGFTLLELMIVMAIVAALVALALPRINNKNNQMRSALRKLSSITRELQSTAKLQGAIYRLVINMDTGVQSEKQSFWIEKATAKTVLNAEEMKAAEENDRDRSRGRGQDEKPPTPLFAPDEKLLKGKTSLPGQLRFEDVEMRRFEKPLNTGLAYIHFFPQGLADEAVIHLRAGEKMRWTFSIHPLTGKSAVATEYISLRELVEK